MPTEPAKTPSPLGQRIAGGALLLICGPIFLFIGWNLAMLAMTGKTPGGATAEPQSLAYMICFAGLMGLLASYGLRMILRSRAR